MLPPDEDAGTDDPTELIGATFDLLRARALRLMPDRVPEIEEVFET